MEPEKKYDGVKEVTREIIGWEDNKVFRTLRYLTTDPATVVKAWCDGDKTKFLSPVVYFFAIAAIEAYVASASGLFDSLYAANTASLREAFAASQFKDLDVEELITKYNNTFGFIFSETGQKLVMLPLVLLFTWLFYKRHNPSFKDNSWFSLYMLGHLTLLSLPLVLYWYLTRDMVVYTAIGFLIAFVYWTWASKRFYNISLRRAIFLRLGLLLSFLLIISMLGPVIMVVLITTR